jgi:peptide/nickel transport system ATP-binding protein
LTLLALHHVVRVFGAPSSTVRAVDDVSFAIEPGESVALVGASGSGKTTLARCALGLLAPTSGVVLFEGEELARLRGRKLRQARRGVQPIFQDPLLALNPALPVGAALREPLEIHRLVSRSEAPRRVAELLERVGLERRLADRYPHELSGGERQRVGIARALACEPRLLIADEPISALDTARQDRILALLGELRLQLGTALLLITHDLGLAANLASRILVLDRGRLVEEGPSLEVLRTPSSDAGRRLLAARLPAV